ncbi:hypothetical protein [Flavobacterium selenitireducens]|uniref:hypothetical protein n=1 Tax=Flavobacterium selenitireducens TaxID=2722704 RepID=UPI00168BCCAF|nr:hypothetical protein [Flavobacterium selenitireducens]
MRQTSQNLFQAKEFSKDIALYHSKSFLYERVIGESESVVKFEAIPLAAASSGELTTILYRCPDLNLEGMILGFYGSYQSENGVDYRGFKFKNFEKFKALEFLDKIEHAIQGNKKFLNSDYDNNNIAFKFDDLYVVIWFSNLSYTIRVFWEDFDSTWEKTAFERSKRRFERKTK